MPAVHINLIAVLVAAVINMGIGMLWYSSLLFGPVWAKTTGRKISDMRQPSPAYLLILMAALLEAYVLAHFVSYAVAITALDGARTGLWLALGLVLPVIVGVTMFEKRDWRWGVLTFCYYGVTLMVTGALLAAWV